MVGILSLIFGIAGILTSFIYIGIFLCVVGITLGIVGLTDCFSEKNFPLAGLLLSILGSVMSVYVIASDMDANKLIVIYNSDDKIYMSNYKDVMEAFSELQELNSDDLDSFDENIVITDQKIDSGIDDVVVDESDILDNTIENGIEESYGTVAIQPDRDWYLYGGNLWETEMAEQEPISESQLERDNEDIGIISQNVYEDENYSDSVDGVYVLNHNTMKFHIPSCVSADMIKDENREETTMSRDEIIGNGFEPCKRCKP